jgi:hypothetical protein
MATGLVADKTSAHYCLPLHKRYSFTHFDLTEVFEAVLTFANNSVNMPWTQMGFSHVKFITKEMNDTHYFHCKHREF